MAMNVPPEENPQVTPPVEPAAPVAPQEPVTPEAAAPEPTPTPDAAPPEQTATNDEQVVEAVAQGLADEEITAEDIMTAVLSDSLGISPAGAQSLFRLLMTELADEVEEPVVEEPTADVPPTEGM